VESLLSSAGSSAGGLPRCAQELLGEHSLLHVLEITDIHAA
jgi:hypothetical protein